MDNKHSQSFRKALNVARAFRASGQAESVESPRVLQKERRDYVGPPQPRPGISGYAPPQNPNGAAPAPPNGHGQDWQHQQPGFQPHGPQSPHPQQTHGPQAPHPQQPPYGQQAHSSHGSPQSNSHASFGLSQTFYGQGQSSQGSPPANGLDPNNWQSNYFNQDNYAHSQGAQSVPAVQSQGYPHQPHYSSSACGSSAQDVNVREDSICCHGTFLIRYLYDDQSLSTT